MVMSMKIGRSIDRDEDDDDEKMRKIDRDR
jgi:hypothetical protein